MLAWNAVADAVSMNDGAPPGFNGKRDLNMFTLLMEGHRMNINASARASGIDEEHDEKTQLLDELLAAYEDWKCQDKARLVEAKLIGLTTYVKRHCSHWVSLSWQQRVLMVPVPGIWWWRRHEDDRSTAYLEFRKHQYAMDLKGRESVRDMEYEERQREREMFREQMRLQHETLVAILQSKNRNV
ncbi:hypothetical protein DYB30_013389 [Aphanomyces astaci]|uniref:Uncharacterized protein n=1 Tax=Aphanomyces astaci TaxID=112090 RepID=A0A397D9D2_APHAT|nr:hypothetical protein DYB30_013389 [Aphanomyces astaci]RHZ02833.1 hypothetical protein DYB26_012554 [Aphanomyces astaci]RHZ09115.1 hypothetical protein DYB31_005793 [Aphanomyces astaci]